MNNTKIMIFILFIILASAMVGVWYFVNYQDFLVRYNDKEDILNKLKRDIDNASKVEEEFNRKNAELASAKEEYEKLKKKVQIKINIPEMLRQTEQAALDTKIKFNEIKIENIIPYEGYSEIPIELQMVGNFHDVGRVLRKLEHMKLFNVNAGTLQLQPFVSREGATKTEINMVLNVKSFILNESGANL
ncbi:MAG: type 4a pilus biogenesis protein PilO [Candidatus Wallbacteria bacterium]